jgi:HEAT repeat protein
MVRELRWVVAHMFQALKMMNLASALKAKGNAQEAYAAVIELGRIGTGKAIELLTQALSRGDGVARSAARELGKLRAERALPVLAAMLGQDDVSQAATDALLAYGPAAVGPLLDMLKTGNGVARRAATIALGELRDERAVEPLIQILQTDDVYAVRTAAATALGQLKDARAVWVLVQTLQLRDETTPERQAALDHLRHAAQLAMRKIGDPLSTRRAAAGPATPEAAVQQMEQAMVNADQHPRLVNDPKLLNQDELIEVVKEVISASEEISWASLESREPLLPAYFKTYEQRAHAAKIVGRELQRRGGKALLRQVHEQQLGSNSVIGNWWNMLEE